MEDSSRPSFLVAKPNGDKNYHQSQRTERPVGTSDLINAEADHTRYLSRIDLSSGAFQPMLVSLSSCDNGPRSKHQA